MVSIAHRVAAAQRYLHGIIDSDQEACLYDLIEGKRSYCFIDGLPARTDYREQETFAESLALGIMGFLNLRFVAYRYEYNGKLIHDIMPIEERKSEASSSGRVELPYHTDMAFLRFAGESNHPFRAAAPDFLILAGVRNDSNICTRLVELERIIDKLSDSELQELASPNFTIASPDNVIPRQHANNIPLIFAHPNFGMQFRFNAGDGKVTSHSPKGRSALDSLRGILGNPNVGNDLNVKPGSILIFNNRKVIHGRGEITNSDQHDQKNEIERHFKRVYGQYIDTESYPIFLNNPFIQGLGAQ